MEELGIVSVWPEAKGGQVLQMPCPDNSHVMRRVCSTSAGWSGVDATACLRVLHAINRVLNETVRLCVEIE